ncbi:hypothetical protein [Bacillus suaedaesalsae]|uniref:Uncharacterized protein n=1 Tax=Bacillus suaedaesalsae TaxID=2810349 RepID=A0ABS2DE23_9BACI|nr:hypothetical protein [Bacillus suaedaesalsae]MBM6616707.1 hypothetical protein [Bacillus suaedaesalsae]
MQIKTKYLSISIDEEDFMHLSDEERECLIDEMVKSTLGKQLADELFG